MAAYTLAGRLVRGIRFALALGGVVCINLAAAQAQPARATDPQQTGFLTNLAHRETLLGDAGGLRPFLARHGITLDINDIEQWLGNVAGGVQQGATYNAVTTVALQLDTGTAFGWQGGLLHLSGLQIRGRSLGQYYLDNLQTVSGIAAAPSTRLWEIWYQQSFFDHAFDIRLGAQSIDNEFMTSEGSALYLNTMMGWPMVPSADLYAGGPAYPLSSLGIRVRSRSGPLTVLAGVFDDNPPGGPFYNDGQLRGPTRWGDNFSLRTGALFIAELQYALNQARSDTGLPGTYKLGVWFDTGSFPNQQYDTNGVSLASPASNGISGMIRHNYSVYGVADQTIWRPDPQGPRALSVFLRAMGAPGDRNLIDFSVNGGVNLKAPLPGRNNDILGIGFGVTKVSPAVTALDRAIVPPPGTIHLARSTETFLEVTYLAQVTPWLQVQPDFQFIHNPGAGIPDPNNPAQRLRDEFVLGTRMTIIF